MNNKQRNNNNGSAKQGTVAKNVTAKRKSAKKNGAGVSRTTASVAAAYATEARQLGPAINTKRKSTRIKGSELVGSILGSSSFSTTKYYLNPGMASTFPLLSQTASQWEQYHFHALSFRYMTRCGSTTVGSVILSPDYDPTDQNPTSEARATTYEGAVEGAVWKDHACVLNPAAMHELGPRKFVRSHLVGGDIRTMDVGNFYVSTIEEADGSAIGKLWVDYDVELFVPQLEASSTPKPVTASYFYVDASTSFSTGVAAPVSNWTASANFLAVSETNGVFTPPAGVYEIEATVSYSDTSVEVFAVDQEIYVNGAALSPAILSRARVTSATSGPRVSLTTSWWQYLNGTDTFQIQATLTGAAGTLASMVGGQLVVRQV